MVKLGVVRVFRGGYKIKAYIEGGGPGKFTESDNHFSIIDEPKNEEIITVDLVTKESELENMGYRLASLAEAASGLLEKIRSLLEG